MVAKCPDVSNSPHVGYAPLSEIQLHRQLDMFTRTEENNISSMCVILREVETDNRINPGPQSPNKQCPPQESTYIKPVEKDTGHYFIVSTSNEFGENLNALTS